jgi:hypothetical protein
MSGSKLSADFVRLVDQACNVYGPDVTERGAVSIGELDTVRQVESDGNGAPRADATRPYHTESCKMLSALNKSFIDSS